MLVYLSIMVGAYIFTRMFTAGIRNYPNDDKGVGFIIRILSIITALVAVVCVGMILLQGLDSSLADILKR